MDRCWTRGARCPSDQSNPGASRALNGRGEHGGGGPVLQGGEDVHPSTHEASDMEKIGGAIFIDLIQRTTNVPGHALDIVIEQNFKVSLHITNLSERFVP